VIQLILDYPWKISSTLFGDHPAFDVLLSFDRLLRQLKAMPENIVPMLPQEALDEWWNRPARGSGSAIAAINRFVAHLIRSSGFECRCSIAQGPDDLSPHWRMALHEALGNLQDWRTPQIIVPMSRRQVWPHFEEVELFRERCGEELRSGPYLRSLIVLENYCQDLFACSDADPWDLRRLHPTLTQRPNHPCLLPRPSGLSALSVEKLARELQEVEEDRRVEFLKGHVLHYLPPKTWDPAQISKGDWRAGRTFPMGDSQGHRGPIDRLGRVWEWDKQECHWDVQWQRFEAGYIKVSHTGRVLRVG
jgi:hypothetical protein